MKLRKSQSQLGDGVSAPQGESAVPVAADVGPMNMHHDDHAAAEAGTPPVKLDSSRDRIVILGRTQAGKTIYLSSLYFLLWKQKKTGLKIEAVDGSTHSACVQTVNTLKSGKWPASTVGTRYLNLNITYRGKSRLLVSIDYPGEVFRSAFIDQASTSDVQELLGHIDSAAAVILLIDPSVAFSSDLNKQAEDEYGMYKAVERIRTWPGGENVPIAIALTKYDKRKQIIDKEGGPAAFVRNHFHQLLQVLHQAHISVVSAVQQNKTGDTSGVSKNYRPVGILNPLLFVLEQLDRTEQINMQTKSQHRIRERLTEMEQSQRDAAGKNMLLIVVIGGLVISLLIIIGFVVYTISFNSAGNG